MTTDTDRDHLAAVQREFGRIAGDTNDRTIGSAYAKRRIAREIEALVRKRDASTDREDSEV